MLQGVFHKHLTWFLEATLWAGFPYFTEEDPDAERGLAPHKGQNSQK